MSKPLEVLVESERGTTARSVAGVLLIVVGAVLGVVGLVLLIGGSAGGIAAMLGGVAVVAFGVAYRRGPKASEASLREPAKTPSRSERPGDTRGNAAARASAPLRPLRLLGGGYPDVEVMGENYRRNSFRRLYSRRGIASGDEHYSDARLVPEPSNKYDPNAVMVVIENEHVGYLPREDAEVYAPVLAAMVAEGLAPTVDARIWASNDDGTWRARVTVALGPVETLRPANAEPAGTSVELPSGRTVQVTGEEKHQDVLDLVIAGRERAVVYATLHEVTEQRPRSAVQTVEVRIDGLRVGALTATTGNPWLPVISEHEQAGRTPVVYGTVKRASGKIEVSLDLSKPA